MPRPPVGYYPRDKRALESKLIVGREEGIGKRIETSGEAGVVREERGVGSEE